MELFDVLKDKARYWGWRRFVAVGLGILLFAFFGGTTDVKLGSAGVAGKYRTTLGSSMTNSQSTLVVSSLTLGTGEVVGQAGNSLYFPTYLTVNPGGSTDEDVECWGLTTSTLTFTGCVRGMSLLGGNATSTVANKSYAHAAGEAVIQSNTPYFFNRFVDRNTNQLIDGTKTFIGNRIDIGQNTTGSSKFIYFNEGMANQPYFRVNGPTAGNTTSTFLFSLDGTNELQLNASGTTLGVETNGGLHLTSGFLGINASTTQGMATDTANNLVVGASSTASQNGGFLSFVTTTNALGKLFWDVKSFLASAWTWAGNQIFSGTVTISGNATSTGNLQYTGGTNANNDVATKSYVDQTAAAPTSTAGFALTPGMAVFNSATSTLFPTNSGIATSTFNFVGIVDYSYASSAIATIVTPGRISSSLTGLSPGYFYYLNGTNGQISTTPGTYFARIGLAISANSLLVLTPKYIVSGTQAISGTGAIFEQTGFYPGRITVYSSCDATQAQVSVASEGGGILTSQTGVTAALLGSLNYKAENNTPTICLSGSVSSKTATGFILNTTTYNAAATIAWEAESL